MDQRICILSQNLICWQKHFRSYHVISILTGTQSQGGLFGNKSSFGTGTNTLGGTTGFGTGLGTGLGTGFTGAAKPALGGGLGTGFGTSTSKSLSTSTTSSTATVPSTLFSLGGKQRLEVKKMGKWVVKET